MAEELKDKINQYLANHYYLNLATVSPQGSPMAHTMAYVSKDSVVYLATNKNTRKVQNIMHNPHVAYTIDEDDPDWFDMQALQVEGKASIITDEEELTRNRVAGRSRRVGSAQTHDRRRQVEDFVP